jgi:hypothetical protein
MVCLEGKYALKLIPKNYFKTFSLLKNDVFWDVDTRPTQGHIPEDVILHSHRCESLKSYVFSLLLMILAIVSSYWKLLVSCA